jgi:hypothetical protein
LPESDITDMYGEIIAELGENSWVTLVWLCVLLPMCIIHHLHQQ